MFSDILRKMNTEGKEQVVSPSYSSVSGDSSPEVIDTGGQLHAFWDHSVLFVANLLALFFGNEEETRRFWEEYGKL